MGKSKNSPYGEELGTWSLTVSHEMGEKPQVLEVLLPQDRVGVSPS